MLQNLRYTLVPKRRANAAPLPDPETELETDPAPVDASTAPDKLAETLLKAIEERTSRAEKSVLRSMALQTGVDEQTLSDLLARARAAQPETLPPETQAKLDEANARVTQRLVLAEVKAIGAEMGLVDADAALALMDTSGIAVGEDGLVTGVREALEALRTTKRYLFAQGGRGAWAQKVGNGGIGMLSGVEEAFYRKNPTLKK